MRGRGQREWCVGCIPGRRMTANAACVRRKTTEESTEAASTEALNPRAAPVRYDYVYSVCIYPLIMHLLTALCYTIRAQGVPVSFEHYSDRAQNPNCQEVVQGGQNP
ncbi:hypothetical protein GQ600_13353 [Phytophthora cactorum]|nr:hypothetical protein GQ600_13353 [Phytophthora cactorum]